MNDYKHADELIAEIQSSLYFKDNPNLIDKVSIYRWIHLALRNFGTSVMEKRSGVIQVENYRANLPKDFGQLSLAVWCERERCVARGNKDKLLQTYLYTDRIEGNYLINDVWEGKDCIDACDEKQYENRIVEKLYIHEDVQVEFHYKNPRYVRIGRDTQRGMCSDKCINRGVVDSEYSINIKGQIVYANFKEGNLYFEYYALPADEDGTPVIPYTFNGHLEEYIEYLVKMKLLEDAMMSKDATSLQGMFQYFVGKEKELKPRALRDTSPLSLKAFWDAISKRRMDMAKFDLYLGARTFSRHPIDKG